MDALKGLYHADKLDEKSFIENFTIRINEFQLIVDNLLQQNKKPLQHFLITGKRGMGKSTLLRRIYIESSKAPLSEKLIAVRLGAEQYRLSRLFKLWEMVIEHLGNNEPQLLEQKKALEKSRQYEENLIFIINDYLTKTDKTLLLLIDNFDQFIDKIPTKDEHLLREILILYPIQIIGNSVFYNEYFKSYNNPFFDFFKPIHLSNLDKEEAEEFIKHRAITEGIKDFDDIYRQQKSKINALRILSGGVPRTLLILLSIVSKKNTGDAVDYLNEMIEQVTPLYQDRMKALSAQQQEIMHNLAMRWDKTPVKELATEMRIPSKSISAQLVQLEKSGYIKKVDVPGRNHYYEIDERFFNIWLLMSEAAPYDTRRVIWLTKWLDAFYSDAELKGFAKFCQTGLKESKPGNRFLIVQALSESVKLEREHKKQLIKEILEDLKDQMSEVKIWADNYTKKLTEEEILLKEKIISLIDAQDFENALNKLEALKKIDETSALNAEAYVYLKKGDIDKAEKYYLSVVKKGYTTAMVDLGNLYMFEKKEIAKAEKYFLMAVEKGDEEAMVNLGYLYKMEKKDITKAEKYYQMAAQKGNTNGLFNLGLLYEDEKKDIAGAEKYYLMAAEKGETTAMFNLGFLYKNVKKDIAGAEKYYLMAAENDDIKAMVSLGLLYKNEKKDIGNAERYFLIAAEKGSTYAMFFLANLYENDKKDIYNAKKYYLMAIARGDIDAMVSLGNLYKYEKKEIAEAEKYYLMAVEKGSTNAMICLGNLYMNDKNDIASAEKYYLMAVEKGNADAMFNLGYVYMYEKKDISAAEKYYLMAVEAGESDAMVNLGNLYAAEKKDITTAEKYYLMAAERGDSDAMLNLGNLYMNEKKDILGAESYYLMAVEKGSTDAMFNLGFLYWDEKKDIVMAENYFLMAAEKGDVDAMVNLGYLCKNEKKDIVAAEKYYLMAVDKGDTDALINLGNLYWDEKKDIVGAERYYLHAIENGLHIAMGNLANLYFEINSTSQKRKALELSTKVIELTKYLDIIQLNIHIGILLWNEKAKDAGKLIIEILTGPLHTDDNMRYISESLQYFLVFKQKQFLHRLFLSNTEWIDRYKPIYFALLHEMQDEHIKEYLKMGSELEEPVNAILDFITTEQKRLEI